MKKSILTIAIITGMFTTSAFVTSCSNKQGEKQEHSDKKGETMQTAYACPMHPEVTGKNGDNCSKCGMALEPVKGN